MKYTDLKDIPRWKLWELMGTIERYIEELPDIGSGNKVIRSSSMSWDDVEKAYR